MKKVSVIIATYNYGKYILAALKSLQEQVYKNWECIIVDDGSTDNTNEIIDDFIKNDDRIKYHYQKNAGPTFARNNGISISTGDYILFLDADDLLESNKIKSHVEVLEQNLNVDIAYGDVRYFDENRPGELLFSLKPENKPWTTKYSGPGKALEDLVIKQNIMVTSSPLIRKEVLMQAGGFDLKLFKLEDWELFQRWAIRDYYFQFVNAPQSLVLMRAHATSFSYDKKGMRVYFLPILEKHFSGSKLNFKNKLHVGLRMIEEYSDLTISLLADKTYPPKHYYRAYQYILPLLAIAFIPFYLTIKLFRFIRNVIIYGKD